MLSQDPIADSATATFNFISPMQPVRPALALLTRYDETEIVAKRVAETELTSQQCQRIATLAKQLVTDVRKQRVKSGGIDALMHQFSLSSEEGIALMCLAEALLRIPDRQTANKLIRDKIVKGDWQSHLGQSPSLFVNASAWGLLIVGKLVASYDERRLAHSLTRLIAKGGEPLIYYGMEFAIKTLGNQFVTGETIQKAIRNSQTKIKQGYTYSYDMLGEAAMTMADAERYYKEYQQAINVVGEQSQGLGIYRASGVSVKLSAIHPRYCQSQYQRVMHELYPRLKALFIQAKKYDIGLNIDAEEADRLAISLDLIEKLLQEPELANFDGIGVVVQAYQKRCPEVIETLVAMAKAQNRKLMIRLVKGAYWDSEIKRAQNEGLSGYPVYTRKAHTDLSYLACAKKLLLNADVIYPQFATHNAHTLATVYELAQHYSVTQYEFQCLHGMGETLYDHVIGVNQLNIPCRIYAPVGAYDTLLAYLVRRILENGANSSFVNQLVNESIQVDELIADPRLQAGTPHPKIALPMAILAQGRLNSRGIDLHCPLVLSQLQQQMRQSLSLAFNAGPLLAETLPVLEREHRWVINPADHQDRLGEVVFARREDAQQALFSALCYKKTWAETAVEQRATALEKMADLMEQQQSTLLNLIMREAGKTLSNAVGEIREAVDFCRFYAQEARHNFAAQPVEPLGVVVAISPWNFPLAIFIGQVASALVAGNVVIAKPAEQTSLIACYATELLYRAGISRRALQCLPGRGEDVGAELTQCSEIDGVLFTGSTAVAKLIEQASARHEKSITLIAETGGQNAMIVDSSALTEQVINDVLISAFDSAGQRCSALRILCLQQEIADKTIGMLKGAMDQLVVGNPSLLSTDVGPVIDREAQQSLQQHIDHISQRAVSVYSITKPNDKQGSFISPTLVELSDLSQLKREVFGPVLHVIRYASEQLPAVLNQINQLDFALTHGIHSRLNQSIDFICQHINAGNIYINRNIVGAVVGVQPFGGFNQSGTGPKAGGFLYLWRLTRAKKWHITQHPAPAMSVARQQRLSQFNDEPQLIERLKHASPSDQLIDLNGITGEKNLLSFSARKQIAIYGGDKQQNMQALIAVLATGATALLQEGHPLSEQIDLTKLDVKVVKQWNIPQVDLILALSPLSPEVKQRLALHSHRVIPVIEGAELAMSIYPLLHERSISINTTAAGGNASLMNLS